MAEISLSDSDRDQAGSHSAWLWHATDQQALLITGIDPASQRVVADTAIPVAVHDDQGHTLATSTNLLPSGFAPARDLGHGRVFPRPDGYVEPCLGPPNCAACAADLADLQALRLPVAYQ